MPPTKRELIISRLVQAKTVFIVRRRLLSVIESAERINSSKWLFVSPGAHLTASHNICSHLLVKSLATDLRPSKVSLTIFYKAFQKNSNL